VKRVALYARVSTVDQTTTNQLFDLRQMAEQRGYKIIEEYVDHGISGTRARRPALDKMMADARRGRFDIVVVWAADRLARSVKHFVEVLSDLDHLGIAFVSFREQIDTGGPLGRAVMIIVSAIAELERSLIVERVRAGMRRARLEGRQIGRTPLDVNRAALLLDRERGLSLKDLAKAYGISKASVCRVIKDAQQAVSKGFVPTASAGADTKQLRPPITAA
jgi:DNA invertase Pin-like site-specific DNA recombinase